MVRNSSVDLDITNNAVGSTIGGGISTQRKLSWLGYGDITLNQASATDNIICSGLYSAAGTIAYGSEVGSYPNILAPGTAEQIGLLCKEKNKAFHLGMSLPQLKQEEL